MTSINAVKFNFYSGLLICDEQRGWNKENLKINAADKIKPVVPTLLQQKYNLFAFYGNTGTSSLGDEIKFTIKLKVEELYNKKLEDLGKEPVEFATIEELAEIVFNVQTMLKHKHIDETLKGRYGFTTADFIRGYYMVGDEKIDIKNSDIIKEVDANLIWKGRTGEMTPIFLNAGILAGYEPKEGFRIFHFSMIDFNYEPVSEIFIADGSGRDMYTVEFTEYLNQKKVSERRGNIDPIEGTYEAIKAINSARRFDIGVDGYYNMIFIDGSKENFDEKVFQVNDDRSKLASEIVESSEFNCIGKDRAYKLINDLFFLKRSFKEVEDKFKGSTKNWKLLNRFLRGYKIYK